MGLAASSSQTLRGGSWAALPPIHFLKPFPDPASPESDLSAPPGLPGAGSTQHLQSPSLCSKGPREAGREGLGPGQGLVSRCPRGPAGTEAALAQYTLGGAAPCFRLTHGLMAHGGALLASWPRHSVRGQCVPRLHFCFSRGHSTMLSWGAQGFSGIEAR